MDLEYKGKKFETLLLMMQKSSSYDIFFSKSAGLKCRDGTRPQPPLLHDRLGLIKANNNEFYQIYNTKFVLLVAEAKAILSS